MTACDFILKANLRSLDSHQHCYIPIQDLLLLMSVEYFLFTCFLNWKFYKSWLSCFFSTCVVRWLVFELSVNNSFKKSALLEAITISNRRFFRRRLKRRRMCAVLSILFRYRSKDINLEGVPDTIKSLCYLLAHVLEFIYFWTVVDELGGGSGLERIRVGVYIGHGWPFKMESDHLWRETMLISALFCLPFSTAPYNDFLPGLYHNSPILLPPDL